MKYYTIKFLQSESFYDWFYLPDISLEHYIIKENFYRKLGTHEEAVEIINNDYIEHCKCFFKKSIIFYNDLSNVIMNTNGEFKRLDEYIFFKLRYYGTRFLSIANDNRNFLEEERKKFKDNNYPDAIITLSESKFHDANAILEYKKNIIQIIFNPRDYEQRFQFYGVQNMEVENFVTRSVLKIEELYEESQGVFVYNTLWYHADTGGGNYSELTIKFTELVQIK